MCSVLNNTSSPPQTQRRIFSDQDKLPAFAEQLASNSGCTITKLCSIRFNTHLILLHRGKLLPGLSTITRFHKSCQKHVLECSKRCLQPNLSFAKLGPPALCITSQAK
ncbi:TPA: hypothetical protein ACH3X1_008951 [Trebouxia sp. C0004]